MAKLQMTKESGKKRCNHIVSHEFFWLHGTCDYIYLNAHYCVLFRCRVRLGSGIDLVSGWLVAMNTNLLSVVIIPYPVFYHTQN